MLFQKRGRTALLLSRVSAVRPARVDGYVPREGECLTAKGRADYTVDELTGCWNWAKAILKNGRPSGYPHRRYYERAYGDIPPQHDIHHRCHNRLCVNPGHLEALPSWGHRMAHKMALHDLTEQDVLDIRAAGSDPRVKLTDLSAKYGLTPNNIWYIWTARSYGHLGGPVKLDYNCEGCGKKLPEDSSRHRRHCDQRCVGAAFRARRRARKKAA